MPEPNLDPAPGSSPETEAPNSNDEMPRSVLPDEASRLGRGQALKLVTSFQDAPYKYPSVSLLPTPIVPSGQERVASVPSTTPPLPVTHRGFSSSIVPDSASSLAAPVSAPLPPQQEDEGDDESKGLTTRPLIVPRGAVDLGRNGSLMIQKRGDRVAQLTRSGSVGSPQRQPTTVLHREREASSIPRPESVPEQVYIASSTDNKGTAWKRVKFLGKGSFSEIVLARPASDYVKPEIREQVEADADKELAQMEDVPGFVPVGTSRLLVAVKITPISDTKDPQLHAFKRDLDLVATLPKHPSLLRMFGSSLDLEVHHRAIFVLPYCAGGDLFELVAKYRSSLSPLLVRRLFADVCSAVAFLHSNLVVHRDIKLENVLLDLPVSRILKLERPDQFDAPLAKLTDLGLARRINAEQPLLTTRCGSDDYVPPELLLGQPYDGRETDSWALGVLLYTILEGRLPFDTPPNAMSEGVRARLRTAHRIARVDWNWYKRKECPPEWLGGKEVVDNTLVRRKQRRSAADLLKMAWVADALPANVCDHYDSSEVVSLFVQ